MWLNRAARASLPALVLFTDDVRLKDPLAAARALPRGSLVVLRARDAERRARLAEGLARIARRHRLRWIVAGDAALAARCGAHGLHLAEADRGEAAHWRALHPRWLITCSAHALGTCLGARHIDAIFLAPVFATASHPDRLALGPLRGQMIARVSRAPVYALGGVDDRTSLRLARGSFAGLAAIGALEA